MQNYSLAHKIYDWQGHLAGHGSKELPRIDVIVEGHWSDLLIERVIHDPQNHVPDEVTELLRIYLN